MRLEWQASKELADRKVSVSLAVEVEGQTASTARLATEHLDKARQKLDPAFWEDEDKPQGPKA